MKGDPADGGLFFDSDQSLTLTLDVDFAAQLRPKLIDQLNLIFVDADQGQPWCYLCFVDWMVKLLGFDTSFWNLHHVELPLLRDSLLHDVEHQG